MTLVLKNYTKYSLSSIKNCCFFSKKMIKILQRRIKIKKIKKYIHIQTLVPNYFLFYYSIVQ